MTSRSSFPRGASSCQRDFLRLLAALLAEVLAEHAVRRAEQVLQEILVPLARRAEQVRAPDEQVAREVLRAVGILPGEAQLARLQRLGDVGRRLHAGGGGIASRSSSEFCLERRVGRQPAHALSERML